MYTVMKYVWKPSGNTVELWDNLLPITTLEVKWCNVVWSTGLKDKNGVETYFDDLEELFGCVWQIVWDTPCACVMLKLISGEHLMKEIPAHNIPKGLVIGNIYENKELLT